MIHDPHSPHSPYPSDWSTLHTLKQGLVWISQWNLQVDLFLSFDDPYKLFPLPNMFCHNHSFILIERNLYARLLHVWELVPQLILAMNDFNAFLYRLQINSLHEGCLSHLRPFLSQLSVQGSHLKLFTWWSWSWIMIRLKRPCCISIVFIIVAITVEIHQGKWKQSVIRAVSPSRGKGQTLSNEITWSTESHSIRTINLRMMSWWSQFQSLMKE